jgi:hypothetical protein
MKKLLFVCLLCVLPASAKKVYVSPTASGTADGSSWANSLGSIQSGLNTAVSGDTVLLNTGVYPTSFTIPEKFTRITIASQYILTGDANHINNTIVDCQSRVGADMIMSFATLDTTSLIAGITFQDLPEAEWITCVYRNFYIDPVKDTPRFRKCNFLRNALAFGDGNYLADSCVFSDNRRVALSGSLIMRNCTVQGNTNTIMAGQRLTMSKCEIRDNKSANRLFIADKHFFRETNFTGNSNTNALYADYLFVANIDTTLFENCVFANDTSTTAMFSGDKMTFVGCQLHDNIIALPTPEDNGALFVGCYNLQLQRCLIYANTGRIIDNVFSSYPLSISGTTIANNNASVIIRNLGTATVINSIIIDRITANTNATYSLLNIDPVNLGVPATGCIVNRDPLFANAAAHDYHLNGYSPAIDAGDPTSSNDYEDQHCQYLNDNHVVDMGYYGNTPEATCRKQSGATMQISGSPRPNLFLNEIVFDTLVIKNTSPVDTIVTYDTDSVTSSGSGMSCLSVSPNFTALKPADTCRIILRHTGLTSGDYSNSVHIKFNATEPRMINYSGSVSAKTFDDVFADTWLCPATVTGASTTSTFALKNQGSNPITITGITFSSAVLSQFTVLGKSFPLTVQPGDSVTLSARFTPQAAISYAIPLSIATPNVIGGIDNTLIFHGTGVSLEKPTVSIDAVSPNPVTWGQRYGILGTASDNDVSGVDPQIRAHSWKVGNRVAFATASVVDAPSESLSIGINVIKYTAEDNDAVWADTALDTLVMLGLPPVVDSLWANSGLVLKSGTPLVLSCTAHDQDESAVGGVNNGDISSFVWYSSIDGVLGTTKQLSVSSATLSLGWHKITVKVFDDEGDSTTSDTIQIPVQTGIGRALIVAGTAFDDNAYFTKNIAPNCNWAYQKLLDRGFSDQQIHYMNPIGWQSLSDPYVNSNIVDTTAVTLGAMRKFILSDAVKNDVQNSVPLIIYLLGHGSSALNNGRFYLNKTEFLTPDTLSAWLDSYGDLPSTAQIIVILDFCYSGSYQTKLRTALTQNRAIISSSDAANTAYFSAGKCFAWNIWNDVYQGRDLATAFTDALEWSNANAPGANKANPQLNCDKNGTYNAAADYAIAKTIFIGGSQQLQALSSGIDSAWANATEQKITVTARLTGDFGKVWSRLYGPGFDPSAGQAAPTVALTKVNDSTWSGEYTGSRVAGSYLFVTEGVDGNGKFVMGVSGEFSNAFTAALPQQAGRSLPSSVMLGAIYPNPSVRSAAISYGLPSAMNVRLSIYDLQGKLVLDLVNGFKPAGYHQAAWNLRSANGRQIGVGYYLCKLIAGKKTLVKKVIVQ